MCDFGGFFIDKAKHISPIIFQIGQIPYDCTVEHYYPQNFLKF